MLHRHPLRWEDDIRATVASGARWQLVTSFNEWGEGTAIESADGSQEKAHRPRGGHSSHLPCPGASHAFATVSCVLARDIFGVGERMRVDRIGQILAEGEPGLPLRTGRASGQT